MLFCHEICFVVSYAHLMVSFFPKSDGTPKHFDIIYEQTIISRGCGEDGEKVKAESRLRHPNLLLIFPSPAQLQAAKLS